MSGSNLVPAGAVTVHNSGPGGTASASADKVGTIGATGAGAPGLPAHTSRNRRTPFATKAPHSRSSSSSVSRSRLGRKVMFSAMQ